MQPTEKQVERSLAALRQAAAPPAAEDGGTAVIEVPDGLVEALHQAPDVRSDRLDAVRQRLAQGEAPSDEELAGRMVGRIVCDRLR